MPRSAPRPPTTVDHLAKVGRSLTASQTELAQIDLRTLRGELKTLVKNLRVEVSAALAEVNSALPLATEQQATKVGHRG